jgi:hypothetical protein
MNQVSFLKRNVGRLRSISGWAVCVGLVAGVFAVQLSGWVSSWINPEAWSSAYVAMAAAGLLQWASIPLALISGFAFLIAIAAEITIFAANR